MNFIKSLCKRHFGEYLKCLSVRHLSAEAQHKKVSELLGRQFTEIDVNSFADLIHGDRSDQNIKKRVELILNEYEYEKQTTLRVPSTLTADQMKELLELTTSFERRKFFHFLFGVESKRLKRSLQKSPKVFDGREQTPKGIWDENQDLIYGLTHNSMFQRISKKAAHRQYVRRLRTAALFGPKVVIDLDFDKFMKRHESRRLLQQLAFLYNYNKYGTEEPFDLHFVNCSDEEITIREMSRYLPKVNSSDFLVTMHYNKSYLDVFPKERLVYLSPHSEERLTAVNDDDIYIIGGIIDKFYREPISAIKAREDGIRCAKLPIDLYFKFFKGSRNLCINQVLAILHDWKINKDWEQTLRKHIPVRKIYTEEEIASMNFFKTSKYV